MPAWAPRYLGHQGGRSPAADRRREHQSPEILSACEGTLFTSVAEAGDLRQRTVEQQSPEILSACEGTPFTSVAEAGDLQWRTVERQSPEILSAWQGTPFTSATEAGDPRRKRHVAAVDSRGPAAG